MKISDKKNNSGQLSFKQLRRIEKELGVYIAPSVYEFENQFEKAEKELFEIWDENDNFVSCISSNGELFTEDELRQKILTLFPESEHPQNKPAEAIFPPEVPGKGKWVKISTADGFCVELVVIGRRNNPEGTCFYVFLSVDIPPIGKSIKYDPLNQKWYHATTPDGDIEIKVEIID